MLGILGIFFCFLPLMIFLIFTSSYIKLKLSKSFLTILLSLIAVLPISLIQFFFLNANIFSTQTILVILLKSILIYGLIEEGLKFCILFLLPKNNLLSNKVDSNEESPLPFLFLSFLLGLTIGCFESVIYFFDNLAKSQEIGGEFLFGLIFVRIFSSVIIHTSCAGLCGLFIYAKRQKKIKISMLIYPILLHGLYDFFACFQNSLRLFAIPVVILAIMECRIKYKSITDTN